MDTVDAPVAPSTQLRAFFPSPQLVQAYLRSDPQAKFSVRFQDVASGSGVIDADRAPALLAEAVHDALLALARQLSPGRGTFIDGSMHADFLKQIEFRLALRASRGREGIAKSLVANLCEQLDEGVQLMLEESGRKVSVELDEGTLAISVHR